MSLDVNMSEPDEFNCSELHNCINHVAKLKGLEDFVYHVDLVCGKGESFIANVFRIHIKDVQSEDKSHSFIVKTLINTERQELFYELHEREVNFYKKIVGKYEKLQEFLDNEQKVIFPKCEYTSIEKSREVIILEDMKVKGFETDTTLANWEFLDYPLVSTAIKGLAKFHALSFITEKHETLEVSQFQDIIFSEIFLNKSKLRNYFTESFGISMSLVEDLRAKNKLERIQPKLLEILKMYTKPGNNNVLCHGDFWINNMMFEQQGKETKMCFIDFQAVRYTSPLTDIMHLLFVCTNPAFRTTYFDDLMRDYYDSLKSFLSLFSIEVNSVYPKENFDKDCKVLLPYGFLIAMIELKLVTAIPEDEAVLLGSKIVPGEDLTKVPGGMDYFKIVINDLVRECEGNGVLDKLVEKLENSSQFENKKV